METNKCQVGKRTKGEKILADETHKEEMRWGAKKILFCKSVFKNSLVLYKIFERLWKEK